MESYEGMDIQARHFAYLTVIILNIVDTLGITFLFPLLVPFGNIVGATSQEISFCSLLRGLAAICSNIWLPRCSDRTTRRMAVLASLIGSGFAYILQACAIFANGQDWLGLNGAIVVFGAGKLLAGLFGGTGPVLLAFVSELYQGQPLMEQKKRVSLLMLSSQAVGLTLAPISGSISRFSLVMPFWIVVSISLMALLWAIVFFPGGKQDHSEDEYESEGKEEPNPYKDYNVGLLFWACALVGLVVAGANALLLPNLLYERESYGLLADAQSDDECARLVSQSVGLLTLPQGLTSLFVTVAICPILTLRFGDTGPLFVVGMLGSVTWAMFGITTRIWQVCLLQILIGINAGFLLPTIIPLMSRYVEVTYANNRATVLAIPLMGLSIGMMFGMNMAASLQDSVGLTKAYFAMGVLQAMSALFMTSAAWVMHRRLRVLGEEATGLPKEMLGKDPEVFIEAMVRATQERLRGEQGNLWSKPMQLVVKMHVENLVPEVPEWDQQTSGEEHLGALWELLAAYPDEREEHRTLFRRRTRRSISVTSRTTTVASRMSVVQMMTT